MNRWKVTTTDESGDIDSIEVSEMADLARIVAASVITPSTVRVQVARSDAPPDPALLWEGRWEILKRQLHIWRDGDDHDPLTLMSIEEIMANFEVSCQAPTIAPWRQRWTKVRGMLASLQPRELVSADTLRRTIDQIERDIPDDELWQPLTLQRDGDWLRMVPGCPLAPCRWGAHVTNMRPDAVLDRATDALALILGLVEHLQEDHQALLPGRDEPTKTPQAVAPYFDLTTVINYVTQMDESGVPVPDSVLAAVERMRSAP